MTQVYVNECKNSFIGKSCEHPATQGNCTPVTCWHCGGRDYPGWIKGKLPEGLDLISVDSYELGNISKANKTHGHSFAGHPWCAFFSMPYFFWPILTHR